MMNGLRLNFAEHSRFCYRPCGAILWLTQSTPNPVDTIETVFGWVDADEVNAIQYVPHTFAFNVNGRLPNVINHVGSTDSIQFLIQRNESIFVRRGSASVWIISIFQFAATRLMQPPFASLHCTPRPQRRSPLLLLLVIVPMERSRNQHGAHTSAAMLITRWDSFVCASCERLPACV